MTLLFRSLVSLSLSLSLLSLSAVVQFASGIEYTANGVAIVGTTESLDINVAAGASRQDLISYEFASYIAVHFAGFNLPTGDSVVITSPTDNSSVSHTYTGRGRDQSGTFIASFVPGSSVTVTYTSVGAAAAGQGYRITGFSRGYPTMDQESICGDGDQSLPAKCYAPGTNLSEGLPQAYAKAQAVARLLINGTYLCTGWLGGSEGHLFTNHHCFEQEDWALTTDFEFAAESSSCSDQCETQLGCAGTIVATTSTFIADSEDIDYSVVQLPDCVDLSAYGYLQLRESGPVVNESIYVPQHPDGYAKRIVSTVDDGSDSTILSVGEDGSCGTDQVGHDADTQGGSSGSPLLSTSDNLVVAIHHCGGCANAAIDVRTVLTDLAAKNVTIENLVASDDAAQSDPPAYAQTPCTAQYPTHSARTRKMAAASNATVSKTTPSPLGTVAASTDSPSTKTTSSVSTSNSTPSTASATTTTTSRTDTTGSSVSTSTAASKNALTSASVVTSTRATTTSSAPSKTSSTPVSSTASSSSKTTTSTSSVSSSTVSTSTSATSSTMADCDSTAASTSSSTSTSTADTVDNDTVVAKLKAAVVGSPASATVKTGLTPAPTPRTTTPASTRATATPVTPSPTFTSTPKPSTPIPTPASTTVSAPSPTPTATPKPTTAAPPSATPAATTATPMTPRPSATPAATTSTSTTPRPNATPAASTTPPSAATPKPSTPVASSGSSGWSDAEQN